MWRLPNTVRAIEPPRADLTARRIFAAGRYTPQKGYDFLIHAWAPVARKHPDWELKICGNGHTKQRLQARIDQEQIGDQTTLAGPTDDVPGEMAQASVYALSSRFEGFPLVLVEAMSKGMACVAFDCPTGPADIIDDHRNGLLVPAKDVEALSAALLEMVEDELASLLDFVLSVLRAFGFTEFQAKLSTKPTEKFVGTRYTSTFKDGAWEDKKAGGQAIDRLKSSTLKAAISELNGKGYKIYVFPDNDNHIHIQNP